MAPTSRSTFDVGGICEKLEPREALKRLKGERRVAVSVYKLAFRVDIGKRDLHRSNMLLRYGVGGGLLLIVLWSWGSRSETDSHQALERVMLEHRGVVERGEVGEGFSLGLERRRALLETRRFLVPPTFAPLGDEGGVVIADGLFADGVEPEAPYFRSSAREVLRTKGIEFGEGASASFYRDSSTLVVTNRPTQLDLVEQLVGSLDSNTAPKQVEVTVKFIEIADENLEELGFDWLLPLPGRGDGS